MTAKKKARDEFTQKVIQKLRDRVNGVCSNPNCRNITVGPQELSCDKSSILGQAAHICAAAPGGPRYDPSMTVEQRKSISNAIWLCDICAKRIDRELSRYPVQLLQAWKIESEKASSLRLGKPVPGHNQVLEGIALFTGQNLHDYGAVFTNTHIAYERHLKSLDPRLDVQVEHINGQQHIKLSPAEGQPPVAITCTLSDLNEIKKMEDLYLFGGEADINDPELELVGSPLFTTENKGDVPKQLSIIGHGEEIKCYIDILRRNGKRVLRISANGKMYRGVAGFKININAWENLFSLSWNFDLREDELGQKNVYKSTSCLASFKLEMWDGLDVNEIEYFDEIYRFCTNYIKNKPVRFTFKSKTTKQISFDANIIINDSKELLLYLEYTNMARIISTYLGGDVFFQSQVGFTNDEYQTMEKATQIITKKLKGKKVSEGKPAAYGKIMVSEENISGLKKWREGNTPHTMRILENRHEKIKLFGLEVVLPLQEKIFKNVSFKIPDNPGELVVGENIEVEFWPAKEFSYATNFVANGHKAT